MVSIVGKECVDPYLGPSKKDLPENAHKTRIDKIRDVAATRREAAKSENLFEKSDRRFGQRLGRR
jgi:hypothetical protein